MKDYIEWRLWQQIISYVDYGEIFVADGIEEFKEQYPSLESYWRSIILFGRNVASYKFALAKSLLEIAPTGKTIITLEELAEPFSQHICEHIANAPKQATSQNSRFLQACKDYNAGKIAHQKLIDTTVSLGFNNVIDVFHVVNNGAIPVEFYTKDYQPRNKKIILTDIVFKLQETPYAENFTIETESRWNLVETAWELGIYMSYFSLIIATITLLVILLSIVFNYNIKAQAISERIKFIIFNYSQIVLLLTGLVVCSSILFDDFNSILTELTIKGFFNCLYIVLLSIQDISIVYSEAVSVFGKIVLIICSFCNLLSIGMFIGTFLERE